MAIMQLHCYLPLLTVLLLPQALLTIAAAQEEYITEQVPSTDMLELKIAESSKISFRVWTNETGNKLYAAFDGVTFNDDAGYRSHFLTVIYNTCNDSDHPEQMCMEAQVTVWGTRAFNRSSISFYLYSVATITNIPSIVKELSTLAIIVTNDTIQKVPSGDTLEVTRGSTNKTSLRIWMNEPGYKLFAAFNGITFTSKAGYKSHFLTVVYNTCTDSDHPELECMEAQVSVRGIRQFNGISISFFLYSMNSITNLPSLEKELAEVTIAVKNVSK